MSDRWKLKILKRIDAVQLKESAVDLVRFTVTEMGYEMTKAIRDEHPDESILLTLRAEPFISVDRLVGDAVLAALRALNRELADALEADLAHADTIITADRKQDEPYNYAGAFGWLSASVKRVVARAREADAERKGKKP